eukprot:GGOE01002626.1.p1 GENE.GGOE01002626.1~~GGOE01002626.1.p1  ORF type:complete len:576 (+),score=138.22 GGOE01002626.1:51-1778(+)
MRSPRLFALLVLGASRTLHAADTTETLATRVSNLESNQDNWLFVWIMIGSLFCLIMQLVYVLLELSIPSEHKLHPLVRNVLLCTLISIWWYCLGWALAYGDGNPFLGTSNFFLTTNGAFPGSQNWSYAHFILGWTIVCLIGTAVSSVLSTRITFRAHFWTWSAIAVWIQAIPAHWIWSHTGWLSPNATTWNLGSNGFLDWGGSAPIHIVIATICFVASWFLGPRVPAVGADILAETRVLQENQNKEMLLISQFIMIVCLFCINSVPGLFCLAVSGSSRWIVVPRAMAIGLVGTFVGPWMYWTWTWWWNKRKIPAAYSLSPRHLMEYIIVSLMSISGGGAFIEAWATIPTAFIGIALYYSMKWTFDRVGLDDPHHIIAMHGAAGMWGSIATGVFTTQGNLLQALGLNTGRYGWIMFGGLEQLGVQAVGVFATFGWVLFHSFLLFWVLRWWQILRPGGKAANRWFRRHRRGSETTAFTPAVHDPDVERGRALTGGSLADQQAATMMTLPTAPYNAAFHDVNTPGKILNHEQLPPAPLSADSTVQRSSDVPYSSYAPYEAPPYDVSGGQLPDSGWNYN